MLFELFYSKLAQNCIHAFTRHGFVSWGSRVVDEIHQNKTNLCNWNSHHVELSTVIFTHTSVKMFRDRMYPACRVGGLNFWFVQKPFKMPYGGYSMNPGIMKKEMADFIFLKNEFTSEGDVSVQLLSKNYSMAIPQIRYAHHLGDARQIPSGIKGYD